MNPNYRGSELIQDQEHLLDQMESIVKEMRKTYYRKGWFSQKANQQKKQELCILYEKYLFHRDLRVKLHFPQENYCDYHGHYTELKCPLCCQGVQGP